MPVLDYSSGLFCPRSMALLTVSDVSQEKLLLRAFCQLDHRTPPRMAPGHPLLRRPKQICVPFACTHSEFHTPTGIHIFCHPWLSVAFVTLSTFPNLPFQICFCHCLHFCKPSQALWEVLRVVTGSIKSWMWVIQDEWKNG